MVYKLKKAYDNGPRHAEAVQLKHVAVTTHILMDPVEFLARLAALVPRPRVNLTRFSGVFAPHFNHRKLVVPKRQEPEDGESKKEVGEADKARGMRWAQRLKRIFGIDVEKCPKCQGKIKIIASIEDPKVITRILDHLGLDSEPPQPFPPRGPPKAQQPSEADEGFEAIDQGFQAQTFPEYE